MSTLSKIVERWGFIKGFNLYFKIKVIKPGTWNIPELKYPVQLRPYTSDTMIFKQIFGMGEYDIDFPLQPKTIIDGGGNIGLFSVLMANRYPEARIFSIEPDSKNFQQLKINISPYKNITAINAGIWNKSCFLQMVDEGFDEWGLQVKEAQPGVETDLKAITIGEVMEQWNLESLDIVKLDVEGAEAIIFKDNYHQWLSRTKVLIIELHERNWPGISANFEKAISQYPFTSRQNGEYFIYTRN
jgi:FkbM family methyltransferase